MPAHLRAPMPKLSGADGDRQCIPQKYLVYPQSRHAEHNKAWHAMKRQHIMSWLPASCVSRLSSMSSSQSHHGEGWLAAVDSACRGIIASSIIARKACRSEEIGISLKASYFRRRRRRRHLGMAEIVVIGGRRRYCQAQQLKSQGGD